MNQLVSALRAATVMLLAMGIVACNGDAMSMDGPDLAAPPPDLMPPGPFMTAPHAPYPQLDPHSSIILPTVKLVTITYPDYKYNAEVQDFGDRIFGTQWFAAVAPDYGVKGGMQIAKVVLPENAPATLTDSDIVVRIRKAITDGTAPAATPGTLYMFYFPASTSITGGLGLLCQTAVGYHQDDRSGGSGHFAYAVIPDCTGHLGDITSTASHELIEAASDPYGTGYFLDVDSSDHWINVYGYENGDMCQTLDDVMESGLELQRSYSNAAAMAGTNPCVPVPDGEVDYNVSPAPSTVQLVAAGSAVTVTLVGWSEKPLRSWFISASDWDVSDFATRPQLSASGINNGIAVTLTLHVPAGTPSGRTGTAMVYSGPSRQFMQHQWPVSVQVK